MADGVNVANLMVSVGANTAMAEQGIMGLALVGEAGPELVTLPGGAQVTPLSGLGQQGLAPLPAGMSGGAGGYGQPQFITISMTMDSNVVARQVLKVMPVQIRNATGTRHM